MTIRETLKDMTMSVFGAENRRPDPNSDTPNEQPQGVITVASKKEDVKELAQQWLKNYFVYYSPIKTRQERCYKYWLGKPDAKIPMLYGDDRVMGVNIIFESMETFLPAATKNNPEAYVEVGEDSPEAKKYADLIKQALESQAKNQGLKFQLRNATRDWTNNFIGAIRVDWSVEDDDLNIESVDPKAFIFDTDGQVLWNGLFRGRYLGFKRIVQAIKLKKLYPDSKKFVDSKTDGKDGTNIAIIEWWSNDAVFLSSEDGSEIFGIHKYPHWNYDNTEKVVDDEGIEFDEVQRGYNYFKRREFPFVFITQANTGKTIHDDTSLTEQSIPIQDLINKRTVQIDANTDNMNGGILVNGKFFDSGEAAQAAKFFADGQAVYIQPKQDDDSQFELTQAITRAPANGLPQDLYMQVNTAKQDIRSITGTFGLSSQTQMQEETVRGKMVVQGSDSSRIGGGIVEQLENVSATLYMWTLQMMYVYYDVEDYAELLGVDKAGEYLALQKNFIYMCPKIYVKEGSLLPKDPMTQRNEAVELYNMGVIDPLTLYEKINDPDPTARLTRLLQFKSDPMSLLGQEAAQMAPEQQLNAMPTGAEPEGEGYQSEMPPLP